MTRVVPGSARGKKLPIVQGHGRRPILGRVKTSLFDFLRASIPGMTMLDLFAVSGNVATEALKDGRQSTVPDGIREGGMMNLRMGRE